MQTLTNIVRTYVADTFIYATENAIYVDQNLFVSSVIILKTGKVKLSSRFQFICDSIAIHRIY